MLNVSELLAVARSATSADDVSRGSTLRFSAASNESVPVVVWNVNRQCNMSCPHCYASAARRKAPDELTRPEARRLLWQLAESGVRIVIFSGGEPLLRSDLLALIAEARSLGLRPQLSTNGVLIDDTMAARLARAGVEYVGVSIDGLPAFNDAYRGLDRAFDRASAGLRAAKAAGMRTGLRMTLTRRNRSDLEPLISHGRTLDVDRFYVSHLLYSGRAFRMSVDDLTPVESRAALERLFELADEMLDGFAGPALVTGGNDSDGPALVEWVRRRRGWTAGERVANLLARRGGNSAGEKMVNIDHRGEVHPDQFWQSASLGNVREQSFAEILAHPLRSELFDRATRLTGRCASCRYLRLCRGSHRERAESSHRDVWASDPACVMTDAEIGLGAEERAEAHP